MDSVCGGVILFCLNLIDGAKQVSHTVVKLFILCS